MKHHGSRFARGVSSGGPGALLVWAAWGVFGAVLLWLWPARVIVRSDDFGYIESVVATIRHGALTASDWLEPLNFILPVLSAALWRLGGSFYVATLGLAAAIALLNFWLLRRWLRPLLPRGLAGHAAMLAVALCPVALNKRVEFTGVPLGLAFFLGALLAWRGRSPVWFFTLVLVGFMNRQSVACLLVLPAVEQLRARWRGERMDGRWIVGGLAVAAIVVAVMMATPANFARALAARNHTEKNLLQFGGQALLGVGLFGGIATGWAWLRGESGVAAGRKLFSKPGPVLGWLVLGVALIPTGMAELRCETPWLWQFGPPLVFAAFAAAAVAPEALAAAVVYGLLVAWRGVWWDYYLYEPALLLACSRTSPDTSDARPLALRFSFVLLGVALLWLYPLRRQLHWAETRVTAYEEALRAGRLDITEASDAPFGFLGWKVFAALRDRAAEPGLRLSDFLKHIEAGRSFYAKGAIVTVPPGPERHSLHGSGELRPLPAGYHPRKFPLNDAEWRDWLAVSER
jgi:hypothetical protein